MTNFKYADDPMDQALFAALWLALDQQPLAAVSIEQLADSAGFAHLDVFVRYSGSEAILLAALRSLDMASLGQSADDFADAPDAPINEKLLEGLIGWFEIYTPLRAQMQEIYFAAQRNPVLAARLLARLADMINRLLSLCGDDVTGWRRQARIKGLMVILLKVRPVWQSDDTADLSLTLGSLDKELRRAAEWAVSFHILDSVTPEN